jgi:hypothetical protein
VPRIEAAITETGRATRKAVYLYLDLYPYLTRKSWETYPAMKMLSRPREA